jgi:hypothetical protein
MPKKPTVVPIATDAPALTDAQRNLIALDLMKPDIEAYYAQLKEALQQCAAEVGIGGAFQAPDGTVYVITEPEGQWVITRKVGYERSRRDGEIKSSLSLERAAEIVTSGKLGVKVG